MRVISVVIFLTIIIYHGRCAKILGLLSASGKSHYILASTLLKALAENGHDVTLVSSFGGKELPKTKGTYKEIVVKAVTEKLQELQKEQNINMFDAASSNSFLSTIFMTYMIPQLAELVLQDAQVQKLIRSNEKFDVVIVEQFLNDADKALASHFGAPLVVLSSTGANYWINSLVGNPAPPSYVPMLWTDYAEPMTFCERVKNTLLRAFNDLIFHFYHYPNENKKIQKYIPNGVDISAVLYNASIVLMNSHPSINQPVPYVPNMIDIGGFHLKRPKKLPQDLQKFLDDAKDGVIYFSMGTNLKSAELPAEKRDAILRTFSKLKEKVLWKWEEDVLPGQPANIKLAKWLPQQDILAHENLKLFITHGGLLSTTETVYHGVPILAIPVFGDQKINARIAVKNGFGNTLPYDELTEYTFTHHVQEILKNPEYRRNAKRRSELMHDRLVSPMETAIYWVEYVIRHRGAPHLRVAALDLPWYQYHLLDVVSFLFLSGLVVVYVFYYSVRAVCKNVWYKQKYEKIKKS